MNNTLLIGLGAIGSLVASKFEDAGVDIDILVDKKRYDTYSKMPICINEREYIFNYVTNDNSAQKYDLIIIATKYNSLSSAISMLDGIMSDDCTIMSLLNGIDSEEIIGKKFGIEKCIYAFITSTDATREGRKVWFVADGKIYFGEKDGSTSERVQKIAQLFDKAGIEYNLTSDIITKQWKKFMVNIGMNQVSAVLNATYGDFMKCPEIMDLTSDAMSEAISVAQAVGVNLKDDDKIKALNSFSLLSPAGKTSMLQDVQAKRITEVNMLAKTLINLGEIYNIATPVNRVLYQQIKTIESMY